MCAVNTAVFSIIQNKWYILNEIETEGQYTLEALHHTDELMPLKPAATAQMISNLWFV